MAECPAALPERQQRCGLDFAQRYQQLPFLPLAGERTVPLHDWHLLSCSLEPDPRAVPVTSARGCNWSRVDQHFAPAAPASRLSLH